EGDVDLRARPQSDRRARLERALAGARAPVHLTPCTRERPLADEWFHRFEGAGLDGVIAKHESSIYAPGKRVMVKVKHVRAADCVVAGFRWHKQGPGEMVGSLLLGLYDSQGALHHVGVTASFTMAARRRLAQELGPLRTNALVSHPWREWAGGLEGGTRMAGAARRRAQALGDVLEVDAHARPGGGAPAHRVDEDVGGLEVGGGLGVPRFPPLEPRQGVRLPRGAADLDQRPGRDPPAAPRLPALSSRRLNARRFARLLGVVGRPRRIAEAFGFLPRRKLQQRLQRAWMPVDLRVAVPDGGETTRHGPQGEVLRPAFVQLLPGERRRDPCVGRGAHRVGAGHRAILGVLVVVEEDAVAFLLPPLAGRQAWSPPLDFPGECQRGASHLRERPAGMETHV